MKSNYLLKSAVTATFIGLCHFLSAQVNLSNGLEAYYPFTGNALDSSGNSYDGIINKAVLTTDRCGNTNSAFKFNGVDAYIEIPSSGLLFDHYSYSMWINPRVIPDTGYYTYPFSF